MRFNCLKTTEPLRGDNLLFTTKSLEIPGTQTSKGWKADSTLEPPSDFELGILGLEIQRLNH